MNEIFDYKQEVTRMFLLARILPDIDLDSIISTVNLAYSLAPVLDPTA